jgi:hypothetical protein
MRIVQSELKRWITLDRASIHQIFSKLKHKVQVLSVGIMMHTKIQVKLKRFIVSRLVNTKNHLISELKDYDVYFCNSISEVL